MVLANYLISYSKICESQIPLVVEYYVLWLKVSVENILLVTGVQS